MSSISINETAEIFKSLGDPTRLRILKLIVSTNSNICVSKIACKLNISQPAVSQHLKVLKNSGLVHSDRKGFHVHYFINSTVLSQFDFEIIEMLEKLEEIDDGIYECSDKSCE
jgi:ArsR family transcriptional regulator